MNLSSKELSALERSGLEKGLKFAIAPRKIPTADIVAAVEESISQLNDDRRHLVRAEVSSILRRAGNTDYTVKNSFEFADFIRDKALNACEELVSLDVVSLFFPVDLAVKVAEE